MAMAQAVIFDLEFTAWPGSMERRWSGPNEHREIVQIGALRVDADTGEEVAAFDMLVRPHRNPHLSDYFVELTGITNADVEARGHAFEHAIRAFVSFIGARTVFAYGLDEFVVRENLDLAGLSETVPFPKVIDIRGWFGEQGVDTRINSGTVAVSLGLTVPMDSQPHNALYDCRSIAAAANHLIKSGSPSPFHARP